MLINEHACANGEPPIGRELVPVVIEHPDRVEITILVAPVSGGASCPGNPWYPITIELQETLAARTVFDATKQPPVELSWPPSQAQLDG